MAMSKASPSKAYYTTSYTFGTSTTSTAALMVWRELSNYLAAHQLPMKGSDLTAATGVPIEQIDSIFGQAYYQRHYGFRRFATVSDFDAWVKETGVLYVPELHDPREEPETEPQELAEEDGEEEEA